MEDQTSFGWHLFTTDVTLTNILLFMDSPDMASQSSRQGEEFIAEFTFVFSNSFVEKLYVFLQAMLCNLFPTMLALNLGPVYFHHMTLQDVFVIKLSTDWTTDLRFLFVSSLMDKLDVLSKCCLPGKNLPTLITLGRFIWSFSFPLVNSSDVSPQAVPAIIMNIIIK